MKITNIEGFTKFINSVAISMKIEKQFKNITQEHVQNVIRKIIEENDFAIKDFMKDYFNIDNENVMLYKIEDLVNEISENMEHQ